MGCRRDETNLGLRGHEIILAFPYHSCHALRQRPEGARGNSVPPPRSFLFSPSLGPARPPDRTDARSAPRAARYRRPSGRCPAAADGLAPHAELLSRWLLVEKSAPARDQMARGHVARRGRHRRCRDGHGARPGTVLGPPDQSRQSARHGTGNRRHQRAPSGVDGCAG